MIKFQQEIGTKYSSATPLAPAQHCETVPVTLRVAQQLTLRAATPAYLLTRPRCLILPVPVVFLLLAFTDQPNDLILAAGKPQGAHTFFWMWNATLPHLLHRVWVLLRLFPKELVPLVMTEDYFF